MSVEENTFQLQLQLQLIIGSKITFKEKGPDLNSRPLSQDCFFSTRAQNIKLQFLSGLKFTKCAHCAVQQMYNGGKGSHSFWSLK